jgi:putative transposase
VFHKAHLREGVQGRALVLHSDNGAPMKGATMLATLQRLGVVPSFSRPGVSDDNPCSEALFKTLKYCPDFPSKPFESADEARGWVQTFARWYNEVHRHSALKFVTPAERHRGEDAAILERREQLYAAARDRHPERWSGPTRDWRRPDVVLLNPGRHTKTEEETTQKAA